MAQSGSTVKDEQSSVVKDRFNDLARNIYLEEMRVNSPGRLWFDKIYVRLSKNGKKAVSTYDGVKDMSTVATSIISTMEEEEGRANTGRFLVVGLVDAEYSRQHSKSGRVPSDRPVERPEKILRALVEMTEKKSSQTRYYVAINRFKGLCELKVIPQDAIFFYDEYWRGVPTSLILKDRRSGLTNNCKEAAVLKTSNEDSSERVIIDISSDSEDFDGEKLDDGEIKTEAIESHQDERQTESLGGVNNKGDHRVMIEDVGIRTGGTNIANEKLNVDNPDNHINPATANHTNKTYCQCRHCKQRRQYRYY